MSAPAAAGLIASALEQELLAELRRHGIVVWLDSTGAYTPFVDDLAARQAVGAFPYPVVAFRGSVLELVLALQPHGSSLDNSPLLIHMPGFTRESIRKTPVLELYEPGLPFLKSPETLVREVARGRVAPDALEKYLAAGVPSLADADAWLAGQLDGTREGLGELLESLGMASVLNSAIEVLDGKPGFLTAKVQTPECLQMFEAYLARQTGVDVEWLRFFATAPRPTPLETSCLALMGWLLSVEYVHDLKRPPYLADLARLRDLSPPLVKASLELVRTLREQHGEAYAGLADEVELRLHEELENVAAEDLGRVDTFRVEEARLLRAALEALRRGDWEAAAAWADVRTDENSFWLKRDAARRRAWIIVQEAAALGRVLAANPRPLQGVGTLDAAVERYAATAFEVDRAQRRFEQRQATLLDAQLPHFGDLKEVVRSLRAAWRTWADRLALDFAEICRAGRFLPEPALQQRALFEQVVQPLAAEGRVAYFLLDAFRYEMAVELADALKAPGTVVDLKPRLAELPTITAVGMNVLAPVSQGGRLQVSSEFKGFKAGEFTVRTPADRARAIGQRVGGKKCDLVPLAEVCDLDPARLKKRLGAAGIVVVHGTELDDAGEANVGPATFENSLRQLRSAYTLLQQAGVRTFVFTADHGFLLLDETARRVPFGKKSDPLQRYVLDEHPRAEADMVNVSLSALGYEGLEGYLLFRTDTAVFATGNAGATFVHGGNSLQERVIPVLTVKRGRAEGKAHSAYAVEAERLPDAMGLRRLRVRVRVAPDDLGQLAFVAAKEVSIAIRAVGQEGVQSVLKDLTAPGTLRDGTMRLPVGDAWSEVFFSLEGATSGQVRIDLVHAEGVERVASCALPEWFDVDWRRGSREPAPEKSEPAERVLDWSDALPEGTRKVFVHIAKYGSMNEAEVVQILGSPRAFRRFSLEFEAHVRNVPFRVRIETAPDGKRYVKEGDK
jgi:hypothetical protein